MRDPALLEARLRQRSLASDPEAFDADLMRAFGGRRAVLITDLSGFSRRTLEVGTPAILALIQTKRDLLRPVLERFHAKPLRFYADNTFAGFESAAEALACAVALNATLAAHNQKLPPGAPSLHICQGIGVGDVIWWGEDDLYGHEVNLASKLGEDTAAADEILLTASALQEIRAAGAVQADDMGPIYVGDHDFHYFRWRRS